MNDQFKFERRVALFTSVVVIGLVVFLVVRNEPFASPDLVVILRIVLSLTTAILGATIPGFLEVSYSLAGFTIRAAGALALFVLTFFGTPKVEGLHLPEVQSLNLKSEIARHLTDRNNCRTALQESEELIKIAPKDPTALNLKGNAHYCLGQFGEALRAFDDALKVDSSYRPARFNKAATLLMLGDYANAKDILESLTKADTGYVSARYNLAVAQAALGDFSDAFGNFKFVYEQDQSYDASFGLGFLYILYNDSTSEDESLRFFKIALSTKPNLVCLLYGKIPLDPELRGFREYKKISEFASEKGAFKRVVSNFDGLYNSNSSTCDDPREPRSLK